MPKWSEIVARVFPWRAPEDPESTRRIRDEVVATTVEQEALAPWIDAQTDYLLGKGEVNGFTRQLQLGFRRRLAGE